MPIYLSVPDLYYIVCDTRIPSVTYILDRNTYYTTYIYHNTSDIISIVFISYTSIDITDIDTYMDITDIHRCIQYAVGYNPALH